MREREEVLSSVRNEGDRAARGLRRSENVAVTPGAAAPRHWGDHDLFTFACAIRAEMSRASSVAKDVEGEDSARSTEGLVTPFLRAWQITMDDWSSGNRDALRNLWTR